MIIKSFLISIVISLGFAGMAWSATTSTPSKAPAREKNIKYVDDKITILMRTGQSNQHKIIQAISSGAKLAVLETGEKYSRVRNDSGAEGWVQNQYLSDEPIAAQKLLEAHKQITLLEAKLAQKDKTITDLNKTHISLKKDFERLEMKVRSLQNENTQVRSLAAKPLKLSNENKELSRTSTSLQRQVDSLEAELSVLRDSSTRSWFLGGAGVVLIGVLIGIMLPRLRPQPKSSWSTL